MTREEALQALADLIALDLEDTGALTLDDPDEDSVGWIDGEPMKMTFGHVRRAKKALDLLSAPVPVDHDGTPFKLLPVDLETHLGDFETACKVARSESWGDDKSYWEKQLRTIARIKELLK